MNTKLDEMWLALAVYQPQADAAGHGESWARMCKEKNRSAVYAVNAAADAAVYAADAAAAVDAAADAVYAAADTDAAVYAAYAADAAADADAAAYAAYAAVAAADAVVYAVNAAYTADAVDAAYTKSFAEKAIYRIKKALAQPAQAEDQSKGTTMIEAMKQALEALEKVKRRAVVMGSTGDYREGQLDALKAVSEDVKPAIASLQQAIAELEKKEPVAWADMGTRDVDNDAGLS